MSSLNELVATGQLKQAADMANHRLGRDANDREALHALARVFLLEGSESRAEPLLKKLIAQGAAEEVALLRAATALQRQDWETAKTLYLPIVDKNTAPPEAWYGLGVALQALNLYEEAFEALEKAVEANDQEPTFHYEFGRAARAWGKDRQAMRGFAACVRLQPGNGEAWRAIIDLLKGRGRLRSAERILNLALMNAPSVQKLRELKAPGNIHEPSAVLLREVLDALRRKNGAEALSLVRDAQALGASSLTLKLLEAKACELLQPPDLDGGLRAYETAKGMDPLSWETRNDLGLFLMRRGGGFATRAVDMLHEAWRLAPHRPEPLFNLAVACSKAGRTQDSAQLARRLVNAVSRKDPFYAHGMALLRLLGEA